MSADDETPEVLTGDVWEVAGLRSAASTAGEVMFNVSEYHRTLDELEAQPIDMRFNLPNELDRMSTWERQLLFSPGWSGRGLRSLTDGVSVITNG